MASLMGTEVKAGRRDTRLALRFTSTLACRAAEGQDDKLRSFQAELVPRHLQHSQQDVRSALELYPDTCGPLSIVGNNTVSWTTLVQYNGGDDTS